MLDLFRQRGIASVVYGVIIFATITVFVIQFRPNANTKSASLQEACVARVHGYCIEPNDQRAAYMLLMPRDSQGGRDQEKARKMGLSRVALDGLIERELLVGEAERLGLKVSDDEVTDELYAGWIRVSVPAEDPSLKYRILGPPSDDHDDGMFSVNFRDSKSKQFDMKTYERQIRNLVGRSPTEFREQQAREMLAAKVRDLTMDAVRVSEDEAYALYGSQKSNAQVTYVPFRQSWVEKWAVPVSAADVDSWAKDAANSGLVESTAKQREADDDPKENHIRHILIKTPPSPTEDDLRAAAVKVAQAKARLAAGSSFAELAREMSDDKGSALRGGDVGDKTDGFVGPFKDAANALKVGEMTPAAIQTQFGLHLIEKDDPAKKDDVHAGMRKDVARELFVKAKASEKTEAMAKQFLADVKAGVKAEDSVAKIIASLPKMPAPPPPAAFVREPKADVDGGAPAASPDASVPATSKKGDAKPAASPKPQGADADDKRPEVVAGSSFNRGGEPVPGLSADAEHKVVDFAFTAKEGDWSAPFRAEDGYVVVLLKDQKIVTKDDFEKERDTFVKELLVAKRAEALALYVKRLRESAKDAIKVNDAILVDAHVDGGTGEDEDDMP